MRGVRLKVSISPDGYVETFAVISEPVVVVPIRGARGCVITPF